jgi:glycerol-3-phosphate O-acyltransferase
MARAYARFFEQIPIDPAWERTIRGSAERGALVYVLRNASLVDYLALQHLTRRLGLPRIAFANELGPAIEPVSGRALLSWAGLASPRASAAARLRDAVTSGYSAVLFMKVPPSVLARAGQPGLRGRREGSELLATLVELQRRDDREIMLVPLTLLWSQRPERLGFSVVDTVFGPVDFPGEARASLQMLLNFRNTALRAGEPLSLREFLAHEASADDESVTRRLTYALLRRVERERRAVVGPMQKPADRLREEVLRSPKLQAIVRDLAGPGAEQRALLTEKARAMLRELQAEPDPQTLKGLELVADPLVEQLYAGVDVDLEGLERVRDAARRGTVILLPSHKSHVDYLLISYIFRKNALQAPIIAAGDNLSFFPLGPIFRRAGAFFIRRSFKGDRLYTAVVDAYIRRLIRDGFSLEFFLEGGRSRTGKLLAPKLGLLNMVVSAALSLEGRTVSFVPISIGYERMMEEGAYARELSGGAKRKEDVAALLKLGSVLREKYGRANVQFGRVISLAEVLQTQSSPGGVVSPAKRRALVMRLGHQAMSEINRVTAVTPGSLVAMALLCHRGRGLPHAELVDQCARLTRLVQRLGARTTPSLTGGRQGELRPHAIREAAIVYVRGGLVRQHVPGDTLTARGRARAKIYSGDDVIYSVADERRLSLDISKNLIIHLFVDRALIAVALLAPEGPPTPCAEVRERVHSLSRLFKLEFMFRADAPFDTIFDEVLADMQRVGELAIDGDLLGLGPGHEGLDGRGWITFYAAVMRNFIEGYRVAARTLRLLVRGPMLARDLVQRALRVGEQMYMAGEISRSEAVSQPIFENALGAFVDQGYLVKHDGKLALAESFASDLAAEAIEAKIASYLLRRSSEGHA